MDFLFYSSEVIPIIEAARENNCQIIFVRDQGVYLMVSVNGKNKFCYAKNCNPNTDEDWYYNARDDFDGDDFGEYFDSNEEIFSHVINFQLNLAIALERDRITLSAVRGG